MGDLKDFFNRPDVNRILDAAVNGAANQAAHEAERGVDKLLGNNNVPTFLRKLLSEAVSNQIYRDPVIDPRFDKFLRGIYATNQAALLQINLDNPNAAKQAINSVQHLIEGVIPDVKST